MVMGIVLPPDQGSRVSHPRSWGGFLFNALPHAAVSNPVDAPAAHLLYRSEHGLRAGGFGILFARKLVDEVVHNEKGNEVIL